jgi:hypothetical protein
MIVTPPSSSPTFIACGARTGSTLLRRLLDSHPAIACPAETDLALLMEAFLRTGGVLLGADDGSAPNPLLAEARGVIDGLASRHLERVGKDRWCDKSLSNVLHLDTLAAAWPDARFILLHRHVMDFIASALDAQPWGLSEFGFASFAAETPGDPVNALAAYWLDRTYRLLAFEQGHPQRCLSLRYEDLVARTDEVLEMLWGFLKVSPEPDAVARAFQPRDNRASGIGSAGRGDNKTWYTSGVHNQSVGRGARIPAQRIKPTALTAVNDLGRRLGYGPIGPDWGAGGPVPGPEAKPDTLEVRVVRGYGAAWTETVPLPPSVAGPAVAAVDEDIVAGLRDGEANLADLTRAGRLRYYGPPFPDPDTEHGLFRQVATLVAQMPEASA